GRLWNLAELDADERRLVDRLRRRAQSNPDWNDFDNFWPNEIRQLYRPRGLTNKEMIPTAVYQIAADLSSRIAPDAGLVRRSDYRDEIEDIIRTRFRTRRAFCKATGLSEDMLSHVLARRKHLAVDTLQGALEKIGFTIRLQELKT